MGLRLEHQRDGGDHGHVAEHAAPGVTGDQVVTTEQQQQRRLAFGIARVRRDATPDQRAEHGFRANRVGMLECELSCRMQRGHSAVVG